MKDGQIKGTGDSRLLKSVSNFKELYPTYESFVAALVNGTLPVDLIFRPEGWAQQPDFLNKANLLQDITAKLYGLDSSSVVDDVLKKLGLSGDPVKYGYAITVQAENGVPIKGATVSGITPVSAYTPDTDETGLTIGFSTEKTVTVSVSSPYADLKDVQVEIQATDILTSAVVTLPMQETNIIEVSSSKVIVLSNAVASYDICAVGGGGGGGHGSAQYNGSPGGGGGGGYVTNVLGLDARTYGRSISVSVGAGGTVGGGTGGRTTVVCGSKSITANGGKGGESVDSGIGLGGAGNGSGGNGSDSATGNNGKPGSTYKFNAPDLGLAGGGGGGGGISGVQPTSVALGGNPNGGNGAYYDRSVSSSQLIKATPGQAFGGGGGGGAFRNNYAAAAAGAPGGAYVRWHTVG